MLLVRRGRALVAAAALSLAGLALLAPPASAHNELASTEPAARAELTAAPTEVVLHFTEAPLPGGTAIVVKGPAGSPVTAGAATITGSDASVALEPLTESGTYAVSYRSVSGDGHAITGSYTFALALPTPSGTPTSASATPATADPATASAVPTQSEQVLPGSSSPEASADGASAVLPWALGIGAIVVVALVGWALSRRTRS